MYVCVYVCSMYVLCMHVLCVYVCMYACMYGEFVSLSSCLMHTQGMAQVAELDDDGTTTTHEWCGDV